MKLPHRATQIRGDYTEEGARACIFFLFAQMLEGTTFEDMVGYPICRGDYAKLDVARKEILEWLQHFYPSSSFEDIAPRHRDTEDG